MNKLSHFNHRINILFQGYVTSHLTLEELINGLKDVEGNYRNSVPEGGSLWFKFSTDDTLATTIEDLEKSLSDRNRDFMLERINECLSLENEIFIFYS